MPLYAPAGTSLAGAGQKSAIYSPQVIAQPGRAGEPGGGEALSKRAGRFDVGFHLVLGPILMDSCPLVMINRPCGSQTM